MVTKTSLSGGGVVVEGDEKGNGGNLREKWVLLMGAHFFVKFSFYLAALIGGGGERKVGF